MINASLLHLMGDDLTVIQSAKVSFDNDDSIEPIDWECVEFSPYWRRQQPILTDKQRGLIRYLVRGMPSAEYEEIIDDFYDGGMTRHHIAMLIWKFRNTPIHAAPFGHCFMSFQVEAPVFVARQLVKHEYLRMSEVSRRYIKGLPEYYMPNDWASIAQDIKQGAGMALPDELQTDAMTIAQHAIDTSDRIYQSLLKFVAPEEARMVLPLCHMTRWRWSGSLDAFMNMCKMRLDGHAQSQTRIVAEQIGGYIKKAYPQSWASYIEGDI